MDEELLQLQRQLEFAQQKKSSVRLSERNVVELVQKLRRLEIIDFDLLHTVSGKEYITPEQLKSEIVSEVNRRGRVSLIDLVETAGVDLFYVEKYTQEVVSNDSSLVLINGEIISSSYWDTVCEEINDKLQECSQISLAEIASQLQVGSELIASVIEPRLGNLVKGRLEGGQLYTPAYVARLTAMVRGAARGVGLPTNLPSLWSSLQVLLQNMEGFNGVIIESSLLQSLFNGLLKGGEILGSLRAGVHWTPSVFAIAQRECVDSFYSQNSFISYETLHKLGISQPVQFLQSRYPDGQPLATIFVHGSLIEMVDAAVEDAIEHGSWIDSLSLLPSSFSSQDACKILSLCPYVQRALKSSEAHLLGESYIFSEKFVKELFVSIDKELESINVSSEGSHLVPVNSTGSDTTQDASTSDKGPKKKKGKNSENAKSSFVEKNAIDIQEPAPKSRKNQKKGKAASTGQVSETKPVSKRDTEKSEIPSFLSEESLVQKIRSLIPDLEEQGMNDPEVVLASLSNFLRSMLINSWSQRRKVAFTENAQRTKQVIDNLQRKLDEGFVNVQLYMKALDLFEDDSSTSVLLSKHLLRTAAAPIVDTLLFDLDVHNKLANGISLEESQNQETESLSPADRIALAKVLPESISAACVKLVESLEGKRVELFTTAVGELAEKSGLILKKLDKKLERVLLHSYRKDLTSQVSSESDPLALLPKVVSLLYVQAYGRALKAPGRAISAAVSRLKDKLDGPAFETLTDYQSVTVSLLSLMAAEGNEVAISTRREVLERCMPALKSLVLGNASSQSCD